MKTTTIAAAAVTAIATISASTLVNAETCSTLTLVFKFFLLISDAKTCADETGYSIYLFTGKPHEEQMPAICDNPTCKGVLQDVIDNDLPDCTIDFGLHS